jgi:hypothetical protein
VVEGANPQIARAAFLQLTKVYHPAKFAREAPEIVRQANEVFLALRAAYETISPVARKAQSGSASGFARRPSEESVRELPPPPAARPPTAGGQNPGPGRDATPPLTARTTGQAPALKATGATGAAGAVKRPSEDTTQGRPAAVGSSMRIRTPTPAPPTAMTPVPAKTAPPAPPAATPAGTPTSMKAATGTQSGFGSGAAKPAAGTQNGFTGAKPAPTSAASGAKPAVSASAGTQSGFASAKPAGATAAAAAPAKAPGAASMAPLDADAPGTTSEQDELESAMTLLRRKQWTEARKILHALAARVPAEKRYRALLAYARGREAQDSGRHDDARTEFNRALTLDPDLRIAKEALAQVAEPEPSADRPSGGLFSKFFKK